MVTLTFPAYNEERTIRRTLETLLELDYPPEERHILVVSDASTDRTDEIVGEFADRGVELLHLPQRRGKTVAENAARSSGSWRRSPTRRSVSPPARDVSVAALDGEPDTGEAGYVGYEMKIRDWETRVGGIIGASGESSARRGACTRSEHAHP